MREHRTHVRDDFLFAVVHTRRSCTDTHTCRHPLAHVQLDIDSISFPRYKFFTLCIHFQFELYGILGNSSSTTRLSPTKSKAMNRSLFTFGRGLLWLVTAFLTSDWATAEHRSIHQFQHTHPKLFSPWTRSKYIKSSEYYLDMGKEFVQEQLEKEFNKKVAKNVILFLGDGMSMPTLAATRMYLGGEEKSLSFEEFPFVGMSKTYCLDYQVADSACTSTCMCFDPIELG